VTDVLVKEIKVEKKEAEIKEERNIGS